MTDTIFNPDGSVYMTFPPVTPRVQPVRFTLIHLVGADWPPSDVLDRPARSEVVREAHRTHFRGILELRTVITELYGNRYASTWSGQLADGRQAHRYTWERVERWHGRSWDTLWVIRDADQ